MSVRPNGCLFDNCRFLHRDVFCRHSDMELDTCPRKPEWEAIQKAKAERKRKREEHQRAMDKEMEEQAEPIGYTYMAAG